jgi:AcrR family transcriptional regulator
MVARPESENENQVLTSSRDRLLAAGMDLMARQGLAATGVKQILDQADAQFSSLYHHFPGGKEELAAEVICAGGAIYQRHVEEVWDRAENVIEAVRAVFRGAAEALIHSEYADACPIGTVAMEVASTNERLRMATAETYQAWIASARLRLEESGIPSNEALELSTLIVTLIEGAFVLCRAAHSTDAMDVSGEIAARLVEDSVASRLPPHRRRRESQR